MHEYHNKRIFGKIVSVCWAILILLSGNAFSLKAQTSSKITVNGTVTSMEDGMALIGVSVAVRESSHGTITDIDGKFSINASVGETLVCSYVGYLTKEIKITGDKKLSIVLQENVHQLNEVVAIGYGQMKRSDLTGSVASLTSKDVSRTVSTTIDQVLSGKIAGVQVMQNSGQPGGNITVRIRGANTINLDVNPLYVVDGMQYTVSGGSTNPLSSINPSDIVSIEVLKDASASAIYGSNGANGVVLITTKRGEAGKTKVNYDGYYGQQQIPKKLETLNLREYATYQNDRAAIVGYGAREDFANPSLLGEGTNWQNELFQTAPMYNNQVSVAGGNDKTKFYISGAYLKQEGIALGSEFDRFTGRMNLDNEAANWLKIGGDMTLSLSHENVTTTEDNIIRNAIKQTPDVSVRDNYGNWGGSTEKNIYGAYATNPIADAMRIKDKRKRTQVSANFYADIKIWEGLTFRNEAGANINYGNSYYFKPTQDYGYYTTDINTGRRTAENSLWWLYKSLLYYDKYIKKHHIAGMLAYEAQKSYWEDLSGSRNDFPLNTIDGLNGGDEKSSIANSDQNESAMQSVFGRLNYSYDDKYLMTFTYRADGSSKFGPDNQWAYFPSLALAWKISNESFMKGIDPINSMKLRLGWGELGNQGGIPNYAFLSTLKPVPTPSGTGFFPENIANSGIRWETTESLNVGLDLNMFQNRIEFIADAYIKNTDDLIIQVPLPGYSGTSDNPGGTPGTLSQPYVNIGSIQNKGLEFTLNTVNMDVRDFRWRSGITFTMNRGKVKGLDTESSNLPGRSENDIISMTQVGGPLGRFYGYVAEGLFVSEADFYTKDKNGNIVRVAIPEGKQIAVNGIWVGDIKWKDVDENGVINEKDRTFIGDPNPDFMYGFTNSFNYKDFDMTFDLQGAYGFDIYSGLRQSYEIPSGNYGLLKAVRNYAQIGMLDPNMTNANSTLSNVYVLNQGHMIPRIANEDANMNNRISNKFIEDGSYLRIKNISIGYNLPGKILDKIKIDRLRLYVNIQNAYTFTSYSGYDPEVGGSNVLLSSYDNGRYPSPRIYTMGLNLGF